MCLSWHFLNVFFFIFLCIIGIGPSGGVTGGGGGGLGGDVPVPSLDLSRVGRDGGHPSKVHFRDGR